MTTEDPWSKITPPTTRSLISARRVTRTTRWGLYWGVDGDRNLLLILQHGKGARRSRRLPSFRGLRVDALPAEVGPDERILIRLTDKEQKDIFLRFCRDIVDATVLANSEEQAVERFLARTWRWHKLLQSGRDKRLTDEEQRGLIGELLMLEEYLLPVLGAMDAVRCWTGPLDAPHDFQVSRISVEAKARSSSAPHISISSEFQLDVSFAHTLFLYVAQVALASKGTANACTLTDVAKRTRSEIADDDLVAVELFEERLEAVGFDWTDDYSGQLWIIAGDSLYEVREGFPRITSSMFPTGVGSVRYSISLPDCEPFRVDPALLARTLGEAANDC